MIQLISLEKRYGSRLVFDDVSLTIASGEKCGLVGRNGAGKTTFFRLIVGKEEPTGGSIMIPKHYRIGYLDQHIKFTKKTLLEEGAIGLPPSEKDCLFKVESILGGLGFSEEDFYKPPSDFSGGYQLRLHLAKVLLSDPDCLLLDEPTNYLDIVSIRWLQRFLKSWKKELVIISHDREFMDSVTTHTLGVHRQKIRKIKGNTEAFFEQILQEEEIHEKTRAKLEQKKSKSEDFIKRFGAKATKAKQAQSKLKALQRMPTLKKLAALDDLDFSFNYAPFPGKQMLNCTDLNFSYDGNKDNPLIRNLNLEILTEDCIGIIGKNGRGKSTIIKLLAGELTPLSGFIKSSEKLNIGYFGQTNIDRLHPSHTIEQEISLSNPSLDIGNVRRICGIMMFSGDDAKKTVSILSGGEKSRVLLGKILAKPCNLLLLDEPTHHLDMESIEALTNAIEEFPGAVVIVSHSEMLLKELPLTKLIVCQNHSQDTFIGNYEDFLSRVGWEDEGASKAFDKEKNLEKQDKKRKNNAPDEAKAKLLNPIQKKIKEIEKEIEQTEKKLDEDNDLLIQAATAEQKELIRQYSKQISFHKTKIDTLFSELEVLFLKYQKIKEL